MLEIERVLHTSPYFANELDQNAQHVIMVKTCLLSFHIIVLPTVCKSITTSRSVVGIQKSVRLIDSEYGNSYLHSRTVW